MKTNRLIDDDFFKLVVESSPNGIIITNNKGKIVLANRHAEKLFGYKSAELVNKTVEHLIPAKFRKNHRKYRSSFSSRPENRPMGVDRNLYAIHKTGTEFPVEIGLSHITTENGVYILATVIMFLINLSTFFNIICC